MKTITSAAKKESIVHNLSRLRPSRRSGKERFRYESENLNFGLLDFWQWAVSDLVSNATRGRLAEYIVARALGIAEDGVRDEWAAYDLITPEGFRIEVKSAAYLQSWYQRQHSSVLFNVCPTRAWDPETNLRAAESKRQAQIYVLALLAHQEKATLDPMNLDQWLFYVISCHALNARTRSQHSITLPSLTKLGVSSVRFADLKDAVFRSAKEISTRSG
jgi:hypothetical protein